MHSCNKEIDDIQQFCSITDLRYQFPYRRSQTFCSHDVHIIVSCHGKNSKDKYKNAHASDPVGKTSPRSGWLLTASPPLEGYWNR